MVQFKPITGLEGLYSISDAGEVRNDRTGLILKQRVGSSRGTSAYADIQLGPKGGPKTTRRVHVLVAEAFLPPRPKGQEPNHKDGDKRNNAATNLEWVTRGKNVEHAWALGLRRADNPSRGSKHHAVKLTEADVLAIYASPLGPRELGRKYGVYHSTIRYIKTGRTWSHLTHHAKAPQPKRIMRS